MSAKDDESRTFVYTDVVGIVEGEVSVYVDVILAMADVKGYPDTHKYFNTSANQKLSISSIIP